MINNNKVLALKYRPQTFDQLIGQQVASQTIFNAIKSNNSANAYIFTGIRGVGKTTFARILAKSLNCENGIENLCKEKFCQNCEAIINSNHIDILEIDAASNTGVDSVRELLDFSRYQPSIAKFKIFIVDEVHMLSKQAFNALLKTLEEPPKYLKFIFATTEVKKIPITVLSRCQRYDLPRVKSEELFDFIKKVTIQEKGHITDQVLRLIVKISEGSVRDALSLLDRGLLANLEDQTLDIDKAREIYGYFEKSTIIDLIVNLFQGNENEVLEKYKELYNNGVDPKIFLNEFLEVIYYIKNASSIKYGSNNFDLNDDEFTKIKKLSQNLESNQILLFWELTIKTLEEINLVSNPNLIVEMMFYKLMYVKKIIKNKPNIEFNDEKIVEEKKNEKHESNNYVQQIKNITQEEKKLSLSDKEEVNNELKINNLDELILICYKKKELKLKYELENNVNLIDFNEGKIEISFNEDLDKNFIKELSNKLFMWTNKRWVILLSKAQGKISKKNEIELAFEQQFQTIKKSDIYKKILSTAKDAKLKNIIGKKSND